MRDFEAVQAAVQAAYQAHGQAQGGANANYIPFLADIPSHLSAIAVVTAAGQVATAGDAQYRFALESISKVCALALALEDWGLKPSTARLVRRLPACLSTRSLHWSYMAASPCHRW